MMQEITMVVPAVAKDVPILLNNVDIFFNFLPISNICVIAPSEVEKMLLGDERITFIAETEMVDILKINSIIEQKSGKASTKRTGWYVQQFIKMSFSKVCETEYYLLWDSDTIPVRKIALFDKNGIPYLDYKTEYHQPYFDTIQTILPGYRKEFTGSFISEHMLINTDIMKRLLCEIESNKNIIGSTFDEKILNSISKKEISESGFSEFETYGTYVYKNSRNSYRYRKWHSLRYGGIFYDSAGCITDNEMKWLSKYYDAVSLEKGDSLSNFTSVVRKDMFIKYFHPISLEVISFFIRVKRKLSNIRKIFI